MNEPVGRDLVAKENLVYQLYSMITEESLRAQLVEITYRNAKGRKYFSSYGILLEDPDQAAEKLGGKKCDECYGLSVEEFDRKNLDIVALFQFMVGNEDWSYAMSRNLKLVYFEDEKPMKLLPYDFDFSGLVNAPYAIPNQDLGMKDILQRKFQGVGTSTADLSAAIQLLQKKKPVLLQYIKMYPYLSKRSKTEIIDYINYFYAFIGSERSLQEIVDYRPGFSK